MSAPPQCPGRKLTAAAPPVRRYYSLFTLGMLVVFECTTVFQRMRHLNELRSLQTPKQSIQARLSWVQAIGGFSRL